MRDILTNRTYQIVAAAAFVFGAILFFTTGGEEASTATPEVNVTTESATNAKTTTGNTDTKEVSNDVTTEQTTD